MNTTFVNRTVQVIFNNADADPITGEVGGYDTVGFWITSQRSNRETAIFVPWTAVQLIEVQAGEERRAKAV